MPTKAYLPINGAHYTLEIETVSEGYKLREFGKILTITVNLPHRCSCGRPLYCDHILAVMRWQDRKDRLAHALSHFERLVHFADANTTEKTVHAAEVALKKLVAVEEGL